MNSFSRHSVLPVFFPKNKSLFLRLPLCVCVCVCVCVFVLLCACIILCLFPPLYQFIHVTDFNEFVHILP
jgi:ABC-type polysaccharide/polyol phosphate export permease